MPNGSFVAQIEAFVAKSKERTEAVVKNSLQDLIDDMQTPVSKGGRMRVDTGFLRASARASLDGLPSGPSVRPSDAKPNSYDFNGEAVKAVIIDMKLGDTFYFGWSANYAQVRELRDGFVGVAVQNWQQIVTKNSERFRGK